MSIYTRSHDSQIGDCLGSRQCTCQGDCVGMRPWRVTLLIHHKSCHVKRKGQKALYFTIVRGFLVIYLLNLLTITMYQVCDP